MYVSFIQKLFLYIIIILKVLEIYFNFINIYDSMKKTKFLYYYYFIFYKFIMILKKLL